MTEPILEPTDNGSKPLSTYIIYTEKKITTHVLHENISVSFPKHSRCSGFLTKPSFPFFSSPFSTTMLYFFLVHTFQLQTSGQTMPSDTARQFHTFFKIHLKQHILHEVFTNSFRLTESLNWPWWVSVSTRELNRPYIAY